MAGQGASNTVTQRRSCPVCSGAGALHERTLNAIDLVRCTSCDMVFANISESEIEESNHKIFASDSTHALNYVWNQTGLDASWFSLIARRYTGLIGPGSVLDIGCGNGQLLGHFRARGWHCVGLDPSPWSASLAEAGKFELLCGFPQDFPAERGRFDLVVSTSTLEHVADPRTHTQAMLDFLRPSGRAYLCGVPNYGSWSIRTGRSSFFANKPPMHVNYFTPATLAKLMRGMQATSFRIRTYGIPELHRLLFLRRKKQRPRAETSGHPANERPSQWTGLRAQLSRLAVAGYYWGGAPLGLGDKLALEIVK